MLQINIETEQKYRRSISELTIMFRAVLMKSVLDIQKQLFIWYGADSYDVYSNSENKTQQALQIESLYNFVTARVSVRLI